MNKIIEICGEYPEDFSKSITSNDPNFVFTPDPLYDPRLVFDNEENYVTVNSFIECENYVSGGWDFIPYYQNEIQLQSSLLVFLVIFVISSIFIKNKFL